MFYRVRFLLLTIDAFVIVIATGTHAQVGTPIPSSFPAPTNRSKWLPSNRTDQARSSGTSMLHRVEWSARTSCCAT